MENNSNIIESYHLDVLIELAKKNKGKSRLNKKLLKKAYDLCCQTKSMLDENGNPKYLENIQIAKITLDEIHLDQQSALVSLLFDLPLYNKDIDQKFIRSEFGDTVSQIIEGLDKIKTIENERSLEEEHLENFRKILISLSTDVRILLVKLAIRLFVMRNLEKEELQKQKEISHETMEIYVPFANRFGLRNIKWQLEDHSFKFINREAYTEIKNKLQATRNERELYAQKFIRPIEKLLKNDPFVKSNKIDFDISARAKHIYSIFNKIRLRKKPLEELYDLIAMRIILSSDYPNACFYVYGIVASVYPPVPETFKDYINSPKKNGYQSIHAAVLGPQRKPVEVQIRTTQMHDFAEEGMAAHFNYKRGLLPVKSVFDETHVVQWMDSVKDIFENRHNLSSKQLMDSLKKNLFFDEIYVFTPANEMITFPKDGTPLDFAFEIHSDLGIHCVAAKVNGDNVPLDYQLKNGDQVEIITNQNHFPDKSTLNNVITPKAKSVINKYLKSIKKQKIDEGQKLWIDALQKENIDLKEMNFVKLYREMNFKEKEDFFLTLSENVEMVNKAIDFLKFKIDYGFSKIEKASKETVSKGLDYSFIVKGEKKDNIIYDILKMMLSTQVLHISSVHLEDYNLKFEAKISVQFSKEFDIRKLMNKIYEVKGVSNVRFIK